MKTNFSDEKSSSCQSRLIDHRLLLSANHLQKDGVGITSEFEQNHQFNDLLDALDFNQVLIFITTLKTANRAYVFNKLHVECKFLSICWNVPGRERPTPWVVLSLTPIVGEVALASLIEASFNRAEFSSAMASNATTNLVMSLARSSW